MCISLLLKLAGDIESNPGPTIRSLSVLQINARSLKTVDQNKNKLVQFKSLMALKQPHVVSICETWLNKSVLNKDILVPKEFKVYRKDRDITKGGGVFLAVSTKIRSKRLKKLESPNPFHNEMLMVEVKQDDGKRIGIITAYRPPDDYNLMFVDNLKHNLVNISIVGF